MFREINRSLESKTRFLNPVLLLLVLLANLIASFWNVDPYHEGAIFPTAVGMAQGLNVFEEVNQQYGFLLPLVISPFLKVFGSYLFISRLVSFLLLVLLMFLTYKVACIYMNRKVAFYSALLWMSVSPIWSYTTFGKSLSGGVWPNHLAMILVLTSVLLLNWSKFQPHTFSVGLAGYIAFFSSQARMEFVLVWLFITLFFLVRSRTMFAYWSLGSICAVISTFLYLNAFSTVEDWFNQTFKVWTMDAPDVPTINLGFFLSNGINFTALALVLPLTLFLFKSIQNKIGMPFRFLLLLSLLLSLASVYELIPDSLSIGGKNFSSVFKFVAERTLFSYINVAILVSLFLIFLEIYRKFVQKRIHSEPRIHFHDGVLWCVAIGVLGVFHNTNADYTSITVAPYLIIALGFFFPPLGDTNPRLYSLYKEYSVALIITSLAIFCLHLPKQVHSYSTPILKNLYAQRSDDARFLDDRFTQIAKYTQGSKFLMVCQTGMLSLNENGFQGLDKWTWNQQPYRMMVGRLQNLKSGDYAVICHLNEADRDYLNSVDGMRKFSQKFADGDFKILQVN